jgi:hypothetical protein
MWGQLSMGASPSGQRRNRIRARAISARRGCCVPRDRA